MVVTRVDRDIELHIHLCVYVHTWNCMTMVYVGWSMPVYDFLRIHSGKIRMNKNKIDHMKHASISMFHDLAQHVFFPLQFLLFFGGVSDISEPVKVFPKSWGQLLGVCIVVA